MTRSSLSTHDTASLRKGNHLSHGQGAENGYAAAQDGGGAEFGNFRSVTPGGHTLDTVRSRQFTLAFETSLTSSPRTRRVSRRFRCTIDVSPIQHRSASSPSLFLPLSSLSSIVSFLRSF